VGLLLLPHGVNGGGREVTQWGDWVMLAIDRHRDMGTSIGVSHVAMLLRRGAG
jgi:hypothetical protein